MSDERDVVRELDRFWNDLVAGRSGDRDPGVAPGTSETLRAFLTLAQTSPAKDARDRVDGRVFAAIERAAMAHASSSPSDALVIPANPHHVFAANGAGKPVTLRGHAGRQESRWGGAALATAALVVLALVGSLVALAPHWPGGLGEGPAFLPALSGQSVTPASAPVAEFLWASEGGPDFQLGVPGFPAVDPEGNVWYTDGTNHRFVIFAPDGTYLESWGTEGSGEGEFNFMSGGEGLGGVAFDADGNIYVADVGNARIQKFGPDRSFLTTWGSRGEGDGQFQQPLAVAVDGQGRVFVSDSEASTLQVFASDGQWLASWARSGTGPGEVAGPNQIAVDSQGNLWVAEYTNSRVQKFSPDGESLLVLDQFGRDPGGFVSPTGIAADAQDRVFVADRLANRVQVFSAEGELLGAWGEIGTDEGQLYGAFGLALDGRGNVYIAEDEWTRLQAFRLLPPLAPAGAATLGETPPATDSIAEFLWQANGEPDTPLRLANGGALDPEGNLWVTDGNRGRFVIFSPEGAVLESWGAKGSGEGEFDFSCGDGYGGAAFDAAGNIYVADAGNGRIQKFSPDRAFLTSWPSAAIVDSQFLATGRGDQGIANDLLSCPGDLALDGQGRIYVSDRYAAEIAVFDSDGRRIAALTTESMRPDQLALDGDGNIWVADNRNRVLKFDPDGVVLAEWGAFGSDDGELFIPMGIAVDAQSRVFIADQSNRIKVFTPDGAFLGAWGSPGGDDGQFNDISSLAFDGLGHVYVVEHVGHRVQKFRLLPPFAP